MGGGGVLIPRRAARLLGRLHSPELGLTGQGVRFAIAGATVAGIYITVTTVLGKVVGLPFQLALVLGYLVGLAAHFTLQRHFVWLHHEEFALPLRRQAARYLVVAGAQYGITAASTAALPAALGVDVEVVYLSTLAVLIPTTFLLLRQGVFHPGA
jgi:putative flippase GtrA